MLYRPILICMVALLMIDGVNGAKALEDTMYGEYYTYKFELESDFNCNNLVNVYGETGEHVIVNDSLTHEKGRIFTWIKPVTLEKNLYLIEFSCFDSENNQYDLAGEFRVKDATDSEPLLRQVLKHIPYAPELFNFFYGFIDIFRSMAGFMYWFMSISVRLILFLFLYSWVFVLMAEAGICVIAYKDSNGNPYQMFINFFMYNFRLMFFLVKFIMEFIRFLHKIIIESIIRILDLIPTT